MSKNSDRMPFLISVSGMLPKNFVRHLFPRATGYLIICRQYFNSNIDADVVQVNPALSAWQIAQNLTRSHSDYIFRQSFPVPSPSSPIFCLLHSQRFLPQTKYPFITGFVFTQNRIKGYPSFRLMLYYLSSVSIGAVSMINFTRPSIPAALPL